MVELRCTYDPETRGGHAPDGRKVRGTIHWVSGTHSIPAQVRLYDHLFTAEKPDDAFDDSNYRSILNPNSLETLTSCLVEPSLASAKPGTLYQFERCGYFCVDPVDSSLGAPVFKPDSVTARFMEQDRTIVEMQRPCRRARTGSLLPPNHQGRKIRSTRRPILWCVGEEYTRITQT